MQRMNRGYGPWPCVVLNDQGAGENLNGRQFFLKRGSQKEQDEADEQARQTAKENLVQSWMDRLQLISVITTFFASVEATMLVLTTSDAEHPSRANQTANASLTGALIMHVFAAIISFLAAFFLIQYKLKDAKREEIKAELKAKTPKVKKGPPLGQAPHPDLEKSAEVHTVRTESPKPVEVDSFTQPPIWSSDPHLEQVGPFQTKLPSHLLNHFHSLCILFAFAGFILALLGIMCFVWDSFPRGVSTFASACFGFCLISSVAVMFTSAPKPGM